MILILGGTSDALDLACDLYKMTDQVVLSTATEYGSMISTERFCGEVIHGKKDGQQLKLYAQKNNIQIIIDGTHPYADHISNNAVKVCEELKIFYMRYERPSSLKEKDPVLYCDTYEEAGRIAEGLEGNIFMTTGSNYVEQFLKHIKNKDRIRVRVLPQASVLRKLESLGLNANHIVAVKGPFSEEMNYVMFKETEAKIMVCKDSGQVGGTDEKVRAAYRLGIKIIMIKRPDMRYPNIYSDLSILIEQVSDMLRQKSLSGNTIDS